MKVQSVEYDPFRRQYEAKFVCHECGKPVDFDANFCKNCGEELYRKSKSVFKLTNCEICALLFDEIEWGWLDVREKLRAGIHEQEEHGSGDGFCYFEKPERKTDDE